MTELKPCPFCGEPHQLQEEDYEGMHYKASARVFCLKCFSYGPIIREDELEDNGTDDAAIVAREAVKAWNNRPIEDALQAQALQYHRWSDPNSPLPVGGRLIVIRSSVKAYLIARAPKEEDMIWGLDTLIVWGRDTLEVLQLGKRDDWAYIPEQEVN